MLVTAPSSTSDAVAAQVIAALERTPALGESVTESTVGLVFKMVPFTLSSSLNPPVSDAVAVQVMVSPGLTNELSRVMDAVPPILVPLLLHS